MPDWRSYFYYLSLVDLPDASLKARFDSISNDVEEQKYWAREYTIEEMFRFTANRAYAMADAMLKAREQ